MADPRDSFFPKRRIRVELTDWRPKRSTQGEKRLRLDFTLPLIDKNRDGLLPEWLISPLSSMEMAGSVEDKVHLGNLLLEGGGLFRDFHNHTATERYQRLGAREEHFAEIDSRYHNLDGAIKCLLDDCGFQAEEPPLPLFDPLDQGVE